MNQLSDRYVEGALRRLGWDIDKTVEWIWTTISVVFQSRSIDPDSYRKYEMLTRRDLRKQMERITKKKLMEKSKDAFLIRAANQSRSLQSAVNLVSGSCWVIPIEER